MNEWIFSLIANAVLALIAYTMKSTMDDIKEQVRLNRQDVDLVKDKYFKKEDFLEFKTELWNRLDRFESDVKTQLGKH